MEVHKHPHHVTHKKKWGEYLLEFLMLFLAVFLGFIAENIREHKVEKEKGIKYVESFCEDLKTDTIELTFLIDDFKNKTEKLKLINLTGKIPRQLAAVKLLPPICGVVKVQFTFKGSHKTKATA